MTEFCYQVDAVSNKSDYCYVYCVNKPFDGKLLIKDFPYLIDSSCFILKSQNNEAKSCKFGSYVFDHMADILSGNDTHAVFNSLIVEHDFSLSVTINATDNAFDIDSYVEFEVKAQNFASFGLIVSDKNNRVIDYYSVQLYSDGAVQIFEHYDDDSIDYLKWSTKSIKFFRKNCYPKIEITDCY